MSQCEHGTYSRLGRCPEVALVKPLVHIWEAPEGTSITLVYTVCAAHQEAYRHALAPVPCARHTDAPQWYLRNTDYGEAWQR